LLLPIAETYFSAGQFEKGSAIFSRLLDYYEQELTYYFSFNEIRIQDLVDNIRQDLALVQHIYTASGDYKQTELNRRADNMMKIFSQYYVETFNKNSLK
jgi:hypothetical protein